MYIVDKTRYKWEKHEIVRIFMRKSARVKRYENACVHVCVCICVKEKERERIIAICNEVKFYKNFRRISTVSILVT